jgi:hypothetical protein
MSLPISSESLGPFRHPVLAPEKWHYLATLQESTLRKADVPISLLLFA